MSLVPGKPQTSTPERASRPGPKLVLDAGSGDEIGSPSKVVNQSPARAAASSLAVPSYPSRGFDETGKRYGLQALTFCLTSRSLVPLFDLRVTGLPDPRMLIHIDTCNRYLADEVPVDAAVIVAHTVSRYQKVSTATPSLNYNILWVGVLEDAVEEIA